MDCVVCSYGVPGQLLSDRGPNLLSNVLLDVCRLLGVKKVNTTSYHPQTDRSSGEDEPDHPIYSGKACAYFWT